MEKRVLLAVVLSFVVLYGYQALFPTPEPARRPNAAATRPAAPQAPAVSGQTAQVPPTAEAPAPANVAPAAEALVHDTAERDIVVDGPEVQAVFSTSGRCPQALASEAISEFRPASRPGAFGADAWTAKTVFAFGWRSGDRYNAFQGFVQAERRIDRQPLAQPVSRSSTATHPA